MKQGNIFASLPPETGDEVFETLLDSPCVRIERIVSRGQESPPGFWYDQAWDEWVIVLRGGARLQLQGQEAIVELSPGDYAHIPAHVKHRVVSTDRQQETVWLAVHVGGREGDN